MALKLNSIFLIVLLLFIVLLTSCSLLSSQKGDVAGRAYAFSSCEGDDLNSDGKVDCADAKMLVSYLEERGPAPFCEPPGEYQDGKINSLDLLALGVHFKREGIINDRMDECLE